MRVQCQMLRHICGNASGSLACRSLPDTAPPSWCSWCPIPTHGGGSVLTRSRGRDPASSDQLDAAPDHREQGRPMLRRHAVHAAVRSVVHVASGHDARLVGSGALDDEDQLVTHVAMPGQRGARLEARRNPTRSPALSSQLSFRRMPGPHTPGPLSTHGRARSVKISDGGALRRSVAGSVLPVMR